MNPPDMRVMLQIEYGNGMARSMVNLGYTNTQPATIGFALGLQVEALRELAIERNTLPTGDTLEA